MRSRNTVAKKAVLYARFSSDNQRSESIDAQIRAMKKHCSDNNYTIIDTYIDEAKSATSDKRPAFLRMVGCDKRLVINEDEAPAVKLIFKLYEFGYGYDYIIEQLNLENYVSKVGKPFGKNSIYSILTNEKYAGTYVFNKSQSKNIFNRRNTHAYKDDEFIIRIPNGCPRIIEQDVFDKVQQKMADNKKVAGRYKSKSNYLLSGLIRCGICGKIMHGNTRKSGNNNKSVFSSYRCSGDKHYCNNKEINKRYLDMYVLNELKKLFLNANKYKKLMENVNKYIEKKQGDFSDEIDNYTNKLIAVNNSICNITSAIEKGLLSDNFFTRLDDLDKEKAIIEATITKLSKCTVTKCNVEDVDLLVKKNISYTEDITSQECKIFTNNYIESILIYPDKAEIIIKTGLDIIDSLNKTIVISRKELCAVAS